MLNLKLSDIGFSLNQEVINQVWEDGDNNIIYSDGDSYILSNINNGDIKVISVESNLEEMKIFLLTYFKSRYREHRFSLLMK